MNFFSQKKEDEIKLQIIDEHHLIISLRAKKNQLCWGKNRKSTNPVAQLFLVWKQFILEFNLCQNTQVDHSLLLPTSNHTVIGLPNPRNIQVDLSPHTFHMNSVRLSTSLQDLHSNKKMLISMWVALTHVKHIYCCKIKIQVSTIQSFVFTKPSLSPNWTESLDSSFIRLLLIQLRCYRKLYKKIIKEIKTHQAFSSNFMR